MLAAIFGLIEQPQDRIRRIHAKYQVALSTESVVRKTKSSDEVSIKDRKSVHTKPVLKYSEAIQQWEEALAMFEAIQSRWVTLTATISRLQEQLANFQSQLRRNMEYHEQAAALAKLADNPYRATHDRDRRTAESLVQENALQLQRLNVTLMQQEDALMALAHAKAVSASALTRSAETALWVLNNGELDKPSLSIQ